MVTMVGFTCNKCICMSEIIVVTHRQQRKGHELQVMESTFYNVYVAFGTTSKQLTSNEYDKHPRLTFFIT